MSEREPIRAIDWDAEKAIRNAITAAGDSTRLLMDMLRDYTLNQRILAKNSQPFEKYDSARLTLQDLKFLYDCGISCE